jgi:uncharacterized protein (TIGR00255 family)
MLKSMTGYGKGEASFGLGRIIVELRCVNHRYGEISAKLPRQFLAFESDIKKRIAEKLSRGKIDLYVQVEGGGAQGVPSANLPLARGYFKAFTTIREALGLPDPVGLDLVVSQRDVVTLSAEVEVALEEIPAELVVALDQALSAVDRMRNFEGESLYADFVKRRAQLDQLIGRVAQRAPEVVSEYAVKLKDRVAVLIAESGLPEDRLAVEVAILADKGDITEELVRLESHLRQFDETLGHNEPVGRKLDFLLQEINREVNTIGSKANDAQIAALVVDLKSELEKIREQVQNVE